MAPTGFFRTIAGFDHIDAVANIAAVRAFAPTRYICVTRTVVNIEYVNIAPEATNNVGEIFAAVAAAIAAAIAHFFLGSIKKSSEIFMLGSIKNRQYIITPATLQKLFYF